MRNAKPDVLIVGAGPVGLTMAAELARHGASCRVIDRLARPQPYCRAIGVSPRTLEVWDDMGVVRPMIDAGLWLRGTRVIVNDAPAKDIETDFSDLPYGPLGIPQPETERILAEHLAGFGITVERPVTIASLEQDSDGVRVGLVHADGSDSGSDDDAAGDSTENFVFKYVIGCDGAHNAFRRLLAIPFEGDHFPMDFMLGDVMLEYGLPRGMMLRVIRPVEGGPPDFLVAIPLPERNRYRVSMPTPQNGFEGVGSDHGFQSDRGVPSIEQLQIVADRLLPGQARVSDLRWSSIFRISMRLAGRYREGRGFISGDAAHIHPPTGGQGMNTGIQDAYNLAWKMALVLKGAASPDLLDSYDAERRPVGADVVSQSRAQSEQFGRKPASPQERLAETQILVNYRGSRLSRDGVKGSLNECPVRAGDRTPDCSGLQREKVRYPFRLFDVTRGTDHVLLLYVGSLSEPGQIERLEEMAQKLKVARGPKCRIVAVSSPEAQKRDVVGATVIRDAAGEFASAYSPETHTGFVLRPDGYIGYHARPMTEQGLVEYSAGPA